MKKIFRNILITLIIGFIMFYLFLPAINPTNPGFWVFLLFIVIIYQGLDFITSFRTYIFRNIRFEKKSLSLLLVPTIVLIILMINLISGPVLNSKKYATRITIDQNKSFEEDIKETDLTKLPLLDKSSSQKLGDRVMGQMSDMVSQYYVSNLYTQINYNNEIVRVTPLEYASFIKWITNRKEGVKGYITVNSATGEAKLTRLDKGMKYVESGYFNDNLYRKLRFTYPTENFGKVSFEIDNDGNPYWIVTTLKYHAIGMRAEVSGVVVLNAITGESNKYEVGEIPTWIDQAYWAELIIEQVNDWGTYQKGFFNSIFAQKNVVNTTEGYNYLAINDDIYLYTGLTSIVSDESNLGFILTNMRTGETSFYATPGAEEFSAMASAEGAVQQMKYTSTFPLLINLNGKPTYLVSLKDAAGLVKMYGFVDVADYQKVVVTDASKGIKVAAENYLGDEKIQTDESNLKEETIKIKTISSAVIDGNTYYYIESESNQKYKIQAKLSDNLPFLKTGSTLKVAYALDSEIINIKKVLK